MSSTNTITDIVHGELRSLVPLKHPAPVPANIFVLKRATMVTIFVVGSLWGVFLLCGFAFRFLQPVLVWGSVTAAAIILMVAAVSILRARSANIRYRKLLADELSDVWQETGGASQWFVRALVSGGDSLRFAFQGMPLHSYLSELEVPDAEQNMREQAKHHGSLFTLDAVAHTVAGDGMVSVAVQCRLVARPIGDYLHLRLLLTPNIVHRNSNHML